MEKKQTLFIVVFVFVLLCVCILATVFNGADVAAKQSIEVNVALEQFAAPDWREVMIQAAISRDFDTGLLAESQLLLSSGEYIPYSALVSLANAIEFESDEEWPDVYCMAIGEMVLAQSDTVPTVERAGTPSERSVRLAMRLLEGERVLEDAMNVVQALFAQTATVDT